MAPAARDNTCRVMRFNPTRSTTEWNMRISLLPTKGRVSREAMVETISLGKPKGRDRMAPVPREVPMEPPRPIRPSISPWR